MDDVFPHEDLSKPENRINVSLFGALLVPAFRAWFLGRLGLPANAVRYPSTTVLGEDRRVRPDFVVNDGTTDATIAWVEVGCGRDREQLERFRTQLVERVIAICGTADVGGADLGLDEIGDRLERLNLADEHPQTRHNLRHLRELIREGLDGPAARAYKVAQVSAAVLETPFVRGLRDALGSRLIFDVSRRVQPGEVRAQTCSDRGFSLRVFSRVASEPSVSVLHQSGGRP